MKDRRFGAREELGGKCAAHDRAGIAFAMTALAAGLSIRSITGDCAENGASRFGQSVTGLAAAGKATASAAMAIARRSITACLP